MCEAVDFFRQALAEQGLDAKVVKESDEFSDTFYVSKTIAGENFTYTTNVSKREQYDGDYSTEKRMAMVARNIAEEFDGLMRESFSWNGRRVTLRPYDEPEATCETCGATVELPPTATVFPQSAELSAPQPMPVEEKTVLESLDEHSRVVLKMYLLGKLRRECERSCPNSKYDNDRAALLH